MNFGNLKYYSRYAVPDGFRDVMMDLVKEILRDQPEDIVKYCAEYFKAKEEGKELEYKTKGHRPIPPSKITRAELDQIRGYNEDEYMEMDGEGEYVEGEYGPEGEYPEGEYVNEGGKTYISLKIPFRRICICRRVSRG